MSYTFLVDENLSGNYLSSEITKQFKNVVEVEVVGQGKDYDTNENDYTDYELLEIANDKDCIILTSNFAFLEAEKGENSTNYPDNHFGVIKGEKKDWHNNTEKSVRAIQEYLEEQGNEIDNTVKGLRKEDTKSGEGLIDKLENNCS